MVVTHALILRELWPKIRWCTEGSQRSRTLGQTSAGSRAGHRLPDRARHPIGVVQVGPGQANHLVAGGAQPVLAPLLRCERLATIGAGVLDHPVELHHHALSDEDFEASASRHLGALGVVNSAVGGGFDLSRFEFRATVDAENSRLETHLVARRAHELEVPGVCAVRLRKGESIRTSVRCVFERNRVAAMLTGVGLSLRSWNSDAEGRYVVALAAPAV